MQLLAAVLVLAAVVIAGRSSASASDRTMRATKSTAVPPRIGIYEPGAPASYTDLTKFTAKTGVAPSIVSYYSSWTEPFWSSFATAASKHKATTFVTLDPTGVTLASIIAGASDARLETYAKAVKAFGHPVLISFGHEMNGTWYSWGDGHSTPADFIAAWRHVVQVFRNEGASNAQFVWVVNSLPGTAKALEAWWPGSAWVNFVGIDGYYYASTDTYHNNFGTMLTKIRSFTSMRVMIAETAAGPNSSRQSQISKLYSAATADHLYAVVWFDQAQDDGYYHQDWRLENDPAALATWVKVVNHCCKT